MRTVMKWIGRAALALLLLLILAAGVVYALSARKMARTYDVAPDSIAIPWDSTAIAEGERLARIRGCYNGCHGDQAEGEVLVDDFRFGTVQSPDLTRVVNTLTDAELERVIRHGVRADGSGVVIMPSATFYHLTDEDLGSIIAFLRSLPRSDGPDTSVRLGPLARAMLVFGAFEPAAVAIEHHAARLDPGDGSDPVALGRYLAMTACTECHGANLQGINNPGMTAPNLAIVAGYSPEEFRRLMRLGEPRGDAELDLMARMSQKRFSHFTDAEIEALRVFLTTGLEPSSEGDPE